MGYPLLTTQEDMRQTVMIILANVPQERNKNEAVVLMGHGTHHPTNAFYAALMFQLQLEDPNIFIGTVEGYPEIDLIKKQLLKKKIKTAYLVDNEIKIGVCNPCAINRSLDEAKF